MLRSYNPALCRMVGTRADAGHPTQSTDAQIELKGGLGWISSGPVRHGVTSLNSSIRIHLLHGNTAKLSPLLAISAEPRSRVQNACICFSMDIASTRPHESECVS
jgi:hypothetical protein